MYRVKRLTMAMSVAVALAGLIATPASATSGPPAPTAPCPQHLQEMVVQYGDAGQAGVYDNSYLFKTAYGPQGGIQACVYYGTLHETTAPDSPVVNSALKVSLSLYTALKIAA